MKSISSQPSRKEFLVFASVQILAGMASRDGGNLVPGYAVEKARELAAALEASGDATWLAQPQSQSSERREGCGKPGQLTEPW